MSNEQLIFIKKYKRKKRKILFYQLLIIIIFLISWELLTKYNIINSFIYSSPSRIIKTIITLIKENNLFIHIITTLKEIFISFTLGILLGLIIALILYELPTLAKVIDPFLTMLNSLPKVALGPLIIIICGANTKSIILMALLINLIVSIITIYNGFINIDEYKLKLFKSMHSSKLQTLKYLIIPYSYPTIITSLKLNVSLTLIGVLTGEFLVSKQGIGYLIVYGKQVFNLNLVMTGIILLIIISYILYKIVILLENKLLDNKKY